MLLDQLCLTDGPHVAQSKVLCGPVYVPVVKASYRIYWQPVIILIILNLTFLMQAAFGAILSRLLPLQLGYERFQYISLS